MKLSEVRVIMFRNKRNAIDKTIATLKSVISDNNCARMNKSTIKGYLGELIVKRHLEGEGFVVQHFGNQTGYDLFIEDRSLKIDVKMSVLKDEFGWGMDYWGWALIHMNKKKDITATHFVCLGCDKDLKARVFVVVPASITTRLPQGIRQFNKVKHGLIVFPDKRRPKLDKPNEAHFLSSCDRLLKTHQIKVVPYGKKLFS